MIDAGPSLRAAERLPAPALLSYLRSTGWTVRPSRVKGISILSKTFPEAEEPIQFILPDSPGFTDEQRRVADALRTIEAIEDRPLQSIVNDVRRVAAKNLKRGRVPRPARKKHSSVKNKKSSEL
jgi:hypothetical protein